jgi:phage recombination protein Bet
MSETGLISKVKYEVNGEPIEVTSNTVKQYLVSGNANKVSNQEVGMFLKLCQGQKLNPFLREAYLVKYGDQAAQMIVGKDAFMKRAEMNSNYKGSEAGIIVVNLKGDLEERKGTFYIKAKNREELVGGWAKVHFKDGKEEVYHTISFDEYNTGKSLWASKPATMIRKVALVQALREAFPNALAQMYTAEEMGVDDELPTEPVDIEDEQSRAEEVAAPPSPAGKKEKQLLMAIAKDKGLAIGEGKAVDISKLEELAKENGLSLRSLTEPECEKLIEIVKEYEELKQEVQDVEYTPVDDKKDEENIEEDPF